MRDILAILALTFSASLSFATMVLVVYGLHLMWAVDTQIPPSWLNGTSWCVVALTSLLGTPLLISAYLKSWVRFMGWLVRRSIMY
jgi:hypothetical protein